jgi:hypothetical protein
MDRKELLHPGPSTVDSFEHSVAHYHSDERGYKMHGGKTGASGSESIFQLLPESVVPNRAPCEVTKTCSESSAWIIAHGEAEEYGDIWALPVQRAYITDQALAKCSSRATLRGLDAVQWKSFLASECTSGIPIQQISIHQLSRPDADLF